MEHQKDDIDVLVIGGGTAGTIAAIQAGRTGLRITHIDYTSGRLFDDAVSYSFYPIDLHDRDGVKPKPLSQGTVATVPLRALIPKESQNLLVAGRSVSSDRLANSALRVQASSMAMGQAAGAAAALSVRLETTPRDIPLPDLRELLMTHGAIVPGTDVQEYFNE